MMSWTQTQTLCKLTDLSLYITSNISAVYESKGAISITRALLVKANSVLYVQLRVRHIRTFDRHLLFVHLMGICGSLQMEQSTVYSTQRRA